MTISRRLGSFSESQAAVSLLFSEGNRPTVEAIRAYLSEIEGIDISFEPEVGDTSAPEPVWMELLSSGLTFDFTGLAPGPQSDKPPRRSDGLMKGADLALCEAITIVPGPHLAGGKGMAPVLRTLAWIGAACAGLDGVEAIAWHTARRWSDPASFRSSVDSWIEGGVFPGLMLTSLAVAPDKGLHSEGLALFTGQELRIEPDLAGDLKAATRLALRLFDYLTKRGKVLETETLVGPTGEPLRLDPSANGRFVRVCNG